MRRALLVLPFVVAATIAGTAAAVPLAPATGPAQHPVSAPEVTITGLRLKQAKVLPAALVGGASSISLPSNHWVTWEVEVFNPGTSSATFRPVIERVLHDPMDYNNGAKSKIVQSVKDGGADVTLPPNGRQWIEITDKDGLSSKNGDPLGEACVPDMDVRATLEASPGSSAAINRTHVLKTAKLTCTFSSLSVNQPTIKDANFPEVQNKLRLTSLTASPISSNAPKFGCFDSLKLGFTIHNDTNQRVKATDYAIVFGHLNRPVQGQNVPFNIEPHNDVPVVADVPFHGGTQFLVSSPTGVPISPLEPSVVYAASCSLQPPP